MKTMVAIFALAASIGAANAADEYEWLQKTSCKELVAGKKLPANASERLTMQVNELYRDNCKAALKENKNPCLVDFMGGASPGHPRISKCKGHKL